MDCYVYAVCCCYYITSSLLAFAKKSLDFSHQNILFTKYCFVQGGEGSNSEAFLIYCVSFFLRCAIHRVTVQYLYTKRGVDITSDKYKSVLRRLPRTFDNCDC